MASMPFLLRSRGQVKTARGVYASSLTSKCSWELYRDNTQMTLEASFLVFLQLRLARSRDYPI